MSRGETPTLCGEADRSVFLEVVSAAEGRVLVSELTGSISDVRKKSR